MFSDKKTFQIKDSEEIFRQDNILGIFWDYFINLEQFQKPWDVLIKKGEDYELKGLECMLKPLISDRSRVCRINYSEFAKDLLKEIDKYRIITNGNNVGDVYKKVDNSYNLSSRITVEGDYLLASNGEPQFKISMNKVNMYVFERLKIDSFDNKDFLDYIPILDTGESKDFRHKVELEISVSNEKSILFKVYNQILKHHSKQ